MKRKTRLVIGCFLICVSVAYILISFAPDIYWSSPFSFFALTITGVPFALCGSYLTSNNIHTTERRRGGMLILGLLIAVSSFIGWILSIFFIVGIYGGTGYWHAPVYSYNGDYMILGFQVGIFFLSVLLGLIGGLFFGLGTPNRQTKDSNN
jgi:MFS family permease